MNKLVRLPILLAAMVASMAFCASANAGVVTVGSPLIGVAAPDPITANATIANITLEGPGAHASSPVSGAVVRWHLLASEGGPFLLRVLRPVGGTFYTAVGTSSAFVGGLGLQTFATDLPIQAGETVGLNVVKGSKLGIISSTPLSSSAAWTPTLPEGARHSYIEATVGDEFSFNAEVQPAPTITASGPSSGPAAGGTSVTIDGTDFEDTTAVKFASLPASSFHVNSEGQITAVAPAAAPGPVNVSVTTPAGSATSTQRFTYLPTASTLPTPAPGCIVPKLIGKKLKAARKSLAKADCKLGKVKGKKSKAAKVKKQSTRAGVDLAPGSKVNVTLGA